MYDVAASHWAGIVTAALVTPIASLCLRGFDGYPRASLITRSASAPVLANLVIPLAVVLLLRLRTPRPTGAAAPPAAPGSPRPAG